MIFDLYFDDNFFNRSYIVNLYKKYNVILCLENWTCMNAAIVIINYYNLSPVFLL